MWGGWGGGGGGGWFPAGENESHGRLLIREEMKLREVNLPSTCRMD